MVTPHELTQQSMQRFLSENRDLIALIKNLSTDELFQKIAAAMQLNPEYTQEVMLHADEAYLNQKNIAGRFAREAFARAIYKAVCQSFLKIQRNYVVLFATKLTPEALAQLQEIEVAAGERQPAPPPPPQKSAEELLVEQIKEDWIMLPSDKLRKKIAGNPQYKAVFNRLMDSNQLASNCTSWHDAGQQIA
jgi:hypothetical protein